MKNIITYLILLLSLVGFSQQNPHYTQYMYNMQIINPAYAGARADLSIGALNRTQWVGIDGAPKTFTFSANARILNGVGIGLNVVSDEIGLFKETAVYADVSYTLVVGHKARMALGLKGGMSSYDNRLAQGITPDGETYASTNNQDVNVGIGAFYYNERFYAGLSAPYLLKTSKFRVDDTVSGISESVNYFATAGMVFDVNEKTKFKPSTMIKYVSSLPLSVDINANFLYNERFELGVSYRYDDSVSGMFALILNKQFRVGYAYDHTLTNLGNYNSGSHEIMLLWDIDFEKRGRWLRNSSCYF